ncbi:hypothetical protein QJQ45_019797 [Haematococcus lacustris]|nr:hypothetical protein QJQ45_019797 [Haematococcus lacustris]
MQELDDCGEDCALRHSLWASKLQWAELTQTWLHSRLDALNAAQLEDTVQRYNKAVFKMERGLMPNKVVPKLRDSVAVWRELVPIVAALRNPHMKDRHWYKVNEVLGTLLERGERLTLQSLVDLKVVDHREELAVISNEATQEAALEAMLDKVTDKWRHVEFSVVHYKDSKDTYILGGVDEVMVVLEDSMVAVGTISASRFVAGIRHEVEKTERQLRLFSDTLDEWLECQKQWLYLETIFSAADIQRQLPSEAKAFSQVDRQFKDIMRRTKDRPNAMLAATVVGMLDVFRKCNNTLEHVQKNLEDYLETKRVSFPRFYFLSNDELLEILSQTRNARAVQPHLQKCFDGIRA